MAVIVVVLLPPELGRYTFGRLGESSTLAGALPTPLVTVNVIVALMVRPVLGSSVDAVNTAVPAVWRELTQAVATPLVPSIG